MVLLLIQGGMLPVFPPRSRLVPLRQYQLVVRLRGAPVVLGRCCLLVSRQRDSGASEGCPVGGSPPDMLSEGEGTGVSSSQATPPSPDVSTSVSTHAFPVTCSSPVPPSAPPSDFPLLGCSRTGGSCPLFHVLRSSSGLPLGQLNPFALRRSLARVLGIQFPDISKLRDGAILVKTPTFAMSQALSRVSSLIGTSSFLEF